MRRLRASHAAGIVHRDLKLDNVFLCETPFADNRRVKLLDWGVAYVEGEPDPFRGLIAGTLTYVAPEQIRGDALTPAADIYSLAVLAFHLLCRRHRSRGRTSRCSIFICASSRRRRALRGPRCRRSWRTLVRMMSKQPFERPDLDEVEQVFRDTMPEVEPTIRFADGSGVNIPLLSEPRRRREPVVPALAVGKTPRAAGLG